MGVRISTSNEGKVMVRNGEESSLVAEVEEKQLIDPALAQMKEAVLNNKTLTFSLGGEDGVLRCQGRLCVPDVDNLWGRVMAEAHNSRYSMHLGSTKMYRDIKEIYWWNGMKMGVANFVSKCPNCQQVKAEHQRPGGLTQLMEIPMWKWEMINMDFEGMEKVKIIQERLKAAQSRQKSYADIRRRKLEFQVDDWVFLRVSPMK
uniref:Integrase zinc-binding domain-containing protein n=1 Tax=Nicotiana tabacum TaxID=4097 RepID=A0A1S4B1T6_TOBAC|nr:PREDICTED: uncharacterized protein LOC107803648 [Nicotiana tabacum]